MRSKCLALLLLLILPVLGLPGGTLTVTQDGAGDGHIKVNGVDQSLPFSQSYPAGTSITLEAVPADSRSLFLNWSGTFESTDNPVTFTMPLFGNVSLRAGFTLSPPNIELRPPYSLDVGRIIPGPWSACYNDVLILNTGGQTLYVAFMSFTGQDASDFFIANGDPAFSVAPGDTHTLTVGFTTSSKGTKWAHLEIYSNDSDDIPAYLSLTGVGYIPDIASDPTSWDFGPVNIGSHADKTFIIRNEGDTGLEVTSSAITGQNASEFTIQSGGGFFGLDEGATHNVTVRFTPAGTGSRSATLKFYCNDPDENPFNVILAATGVSSPAGIPDIASNPASWDFGAVNPGSSSDKTFVISNAGDADLNVTVVTLSGADASDFQIQSGGGSFTLAPAATRNVVVRFSPASSGVKNASLSFTSNDHDENPFLVYLTGGGGLTIVLDGNKDGFYSTLTGEGFLNIPSPLYNLNGVPSDDRDLSAKVWIAWDDTYLYVYEEVKDDTVHLNNVTDWANDCIELKIDPDPSKRATDGVMTFNLSALDSADTQPAYYSGISNLPDKSDYARRRTSDGYILELRVKWSNMTLSGRGPVVPAVGNVFGFAINQHDNDQFGRQATVQWSAKLADEVWYNPRLLGKATFQTGHKLKLEAKNAIDDTLVNPLAALYVPNDLPWPMLTMDVGSVQAEGSAAYEGGTGTYTVSGSGVDIWDYADEFRYVFRQVSGNVEFVAKITSLTKSDPWTKAGLMIRDGLTPNSAHAMMAVASDNGLTFQNRERAGALCTYVAGNTAVKPPYWLKIVRSGNTFIGLASSDGVSWVEIGRKSIAMQDPVYVGMAVTAHHDGSLSTGTFSNVTYKFTEMISPITPAFQRGFNLLEWFDVPSSGQIQLDSYNEEDFQILKAMGCEAIRLPIDILTIAGPPPDYKLDSLFFAFLDIVVDRAEAAGLYIILLNGSWDPIIGIDPTIEPALLATWTQMARHFKNRSNLVIYEVLNEPHGISDADWNVIQEHAIEAIRAEDGFHTIVVTPANWSGYYNLNSLPYYSDNNLLYTFHFYSPLLFTHQGTTWGDPVPADLTGVPFPYNASTMPALPASLVGTWWQDMYNRYPQEGNEAWVRSQLDLAAQFQSEQNVALWCGEFGAYPATSLSHDRAMWTGIVRSYFEEKGIAWTFVTDGLFEKNTVGCFETDVDTLITSALGLTAPIQKEPASQPETSGFTFYDDYMPHGLFKSGWFSNGEFDFYSRESPYEGKYCMKISGFERYGNFAFRFRPYRDLSYLVDHGSALDFWVRCASPGTQIDIRFEDTKTSDPNDHPWRRSITLSSSVVPWDGQWHHLSIPLKDFVETGSWDNNQWYNPEGRFDWKATDQLIIDAQHHSLDGIDIYFDDIRMTDPNLNVTSLDGVPYEFRLQQNYPNPFNPSTTIKYQLGKASHVVLTIYNLAGQKITTLIDAFQPAGDHEVTWQSQGLPSGLYFYRLEAGDFSETKKIILQK